jgi:hypothetical protein
MSGKQAMSNETVTLLSRHQEARKAAPALVVERITESTYRRWVIEPGAKCADHPYGFACGNKAEFLVRTLGAKGAFRVCASCLPKRAKHMLERPAGEAERIEAEKIERLRAAKAINDAKKAHDDAGLCEATTRKTLSGKCERPPKFLVETPYSGERGSGEEKLCAHHTAPWRRKTVREYVKEECADGTVVLRYYGDGLQERLRRIRPLLSVAEFRRITMEGDERATSDSAGTSAGHPGEGGKGDG